MLHAPIEIEDPDIVQAIADFREPAAELRERTKALAAMSGTDRRRPLEEASVEEILSRIVVRAERIGISADHLLSILNTDAYRAAASATPPSAKALMDTLSVCREAEAKAHEELSAAQNKMRLATAARLAAEKAYHKHAKAAL